MRQLVMLDLFSGLGGASESEKRNGWRVIRVDNEPRCNPDILADVRYLPFDPFPVDLLWCSPPCEQYSAKYQFGSWHPNQPEPDKALWQACLEHIDNFRPRFYVIENVRGAQKVWGKSDFHFASRYLWTDIPFMIQPDHVPWKMGRIDRVGRAKGNKKPGYWESSRIPISVSDIVRLSVECQL